MDRGHHKLMPSSEMRLAALICFTAILSAGQISSPLAQGGQTEVAKTVPSSPPPVAAPVTPPVPAPQATPAAPVPQAAATPKATAPSSPVGGGANWQANVATQAPASGVPQESDLQVVEKINAYFNGLSDLQGTFTQTDPDNKQKHGKFYFEKPGKVRFDYGTPSKLKIISNGEYLAIEDHDLQTSDRYPLEMTPFRLLLSQNVNLGNDAKILAVDQSPDAIVLTVEDKKNENGGRIRLIFNKPSVSLREWIVSDPQGLDTRIEVSGLEQNKKVAAETFEFSKNIGFKNMER